MSKTDIQNQREPLVRGHDNSMARYEHPDGWVIITEGTIYSVINSLGGLERRCDISKWSDSAERWIDNDIKDGYYPGFVKVK